MLIELSIISVFGVKTTEKLILSFVIFETIITFAKTFATKIFAL